MSDNKVFNVGDRVARQVLNRRSSLRGGSVVARGCEEHDTYIVRWDKNKFPSYGSKKQEVEEVDVADLTIETDAKAKVKQLDADFDVLEEKIKGKLQQAAELIGEAEAMADANGEMLSELHEATYPLMNALDNAGWATSSLSC